MKTVADFDYWKTASDWRSHIVDYLKTSRDLIEDWDSTFLETTKVLSDVYLTLHAQRMVARPDPRSEGELEDLFWNLQRSSTVIDSVVGSACVALMRWMDRAKRIAIWSFILLETKFPFELEEEAFKDKWHRHNRSIMQDFGSSLPGKQISGALAIWQIGNVFKHGGADELRNETKEIARKLGFSSGVFGIPENEGDEVLRQLALKEVGATLDADSIERMAIQLGCGPAPGLMPLYDHARSWSEAINKRLSDEQVALGSG